MFCPIFTHHPSVSRLVLDNRIACWGIGLLAVLHDRAFASATFNQFPTLFIALGN
jgi:hypothetical protein